MNLKQFLRRPVVIAVAAAAILITGAGVAVAATTVRAGTSVTRVTVLTQDAAAVYASASWTTIGSEALYATAGSFIVTTFTAESACYGGSGWCSVRILVDGVEAQPAVGTDFAFDSTNGGADGASSWESHSVQRTQTVGTSAGHTVTLQVATVGGGVVDRLDDWTLTSMAVTP